MEWHVDELKIFKENKFLVGVDEAGRGPLAGPVVAAAVILPEDFPVEILEDSKKLTAKKREAAYIVIREKAISVPSGLIDGSVLYFPSSEMRRTLPLLKSFRKI